MAARNASARLPRAMESVLAQDAGSLELVCAVWGSADRTEDVAARAAERDIRVEVVRDAGSTRLEAWEAGVRVARSPYVLMMDAEDWLAPGALEQACNQTAREKLDLLFCGVIADAPEDDQAGHAVERCVADMRAVTGAEARAAAPRLLGAGFLSAGEAKLLRAEVAVEAFCAVRRADAAPTETAFALACLDGAARVGASEVPGYHLTARSCANRTASADGALDAVRFAALGQTALDALLAAFTRWGQADTSVGAEALQMAFLRVLAACAGAVCVKDCALGPEEKRALIGDMILSHAFQEVMGACTPRDWMRRYVARAILRRDVNLCYLESCLMSAVGPDRLFPLRAS